MSRQDRIEMNRYKNMAEEACQTLDLMKTAHEELRNDYAWVLKLLHAAIKVTPQAMIILSPEQLSDTNPELMRLHTREIPNKEETEATIILELVPADEGEPVKEVAADPADSTKDN